ncbi:uncharacterized protein EI97DRAFT_435423 [Westerdykella ornata]|uniref:Uncharacterized protein n=1 Tax=Westerdykella ornata TaxID=318751 RepID=A0A6A6JCZ8_WESOR|nr:uncharacterized protein EI97DRAFT_435423 [Westerdykella ornata]KAF2274053.1 hypothetical protein EI97DRAFT_435423 [Westerdykella ornata]
MAGLLLAALGVCLGRSIEKAWYTLEDRRDRRKDEKLEKLESDKLGMAMGPGNGMMPGVGSRRRDVGMSEKEKREKRDRTASVFMDPLAPNLYDHSAQLSPTYARARPRTSPSSSSSPPPSHLRRSRLSNLRQRHSLLVLPSRSRNNNNNRHSFAAGGTSSGMEAGKRRSRSKRTTWHGWAALHAHAHAHGEGDVFGDYVALIEEEGEEGGDGYDHEQEVEQHDSSEKVETERRQEGARDRVALRRRSVAVPARREWRSSCETLVACGCRVDRGAGGSKIGAAQI